MSTKKGCDECAARHAWKAVKSRYKQLFGLCHDDSNNSDEICDILDNLVATEQDWVLCRPMKKPHGSETLLMQAVWNLKVNVVKKLVEIYLDIGGDINYTNEHGHGIATYWNIARLDFSDGEDAACEIVEILFNAGARLSASYDGWSVVDIAKKKNFHKLKAKLDSLYNATEDNDEPVVLTPYSISHADLARIVAEDEKTPPRYHFSEAALEPTEPSPGYMADQYLDGEALWRVVRDESYDMMNAPNLDHVPDHILRHAVELNGEVENSKLGPQRLPQEKCDCYSRYGVCMCYTL
jgi:hypothetical protein